MQTVGDVPGEKESIMAVDMFLDIEGVEGESHDETYKGKIQVLSWSWGETNQGSGGSPVTAFVGFQTYNTNKSLRIANLNFVGDGGSVSNTTLPVINITSTGPLGDLILNSKALASFNITVPEELKAKAKTIE